MSQQGGAGPARESVPGPGATHQARLRTQWRRTPEGVVWTVRSVWTGGHGGPGWCYLRSAGGGHRRELRSVIEREWIWEGDS